MKCRDVKRNMSAYLDGELPSLVRDAFFDHLQECEDCCNLIGEASFHETLIATAMKQRMEAPSAIRYNVLSALSREAARPTIVPAWQRFAWRPAATMAAILALAGTGWRTFNESLEPGAPVPTAKTQVESSAKTAKTASTEKSGKSALHYVAPAVKTFPTPKPATHETMVASAVKPSARLAKPATKPLAPAAKPAAPAATAPDAPVVATDDPVGTVTYILAPSDVLNGRFLSRRDGKGLWKDASPNLHVKTHLQSAEDTIVTMELRDGTVLKSNQRTEFVVLRSPTKEMPSWEIRLVRGELWVKTGTGVKVTAPGLDADTANGEFSIRSIDGEDSSVIAVDGKVDCRNPLGDVTLTGDPEADQGEATASLSGEAPQAAFSVAEPKAQLDWAYAPAPAHNALNDGGTQA